MLRPDKLPVPGASEIEEGKSAIAEAAAVAAGLDLSSRRELNRLNALLRRDRMDGHVHLLLVIGLWIAALALLGIFISLVWNMAAPDQVRFLTSDETKSLQQFLFSGLIGSAITAAAKKVSGGSEQGD